MSQREKVVVEMLKQIVRSFIADRATVGNYDRLTYLNVPAERKSWDVSRSACFVG